MPRLRGTGAGVGLALILGLPVYPTDSSSAFSHVLVPMDEDPCAHSETGALLVPQIPTIKEGRKAIRKCQSY